MQHMELANNRIKQFVFKYLQMDNMVYLHFSINTSSFLSKNKTCYNLTQLNIKYYFK